MSEEKDNCGDDYDDGGDSSSNSGGSGGVERNEPWAQPLASGIAKRIVLDFLSSSSSSPSSSSSHVNKKGETFDLPIREQIFGERYPRNRTLQVVRFLS